MKEGKKSERKREKKSEKEDVVLFLT